MVVLQFPAPTSRQADATIDVLTWLLDVAKKGDLLGGGVGLVVRDKYGTESIVLTGYYSADPREANRVAVEFVESQAIRKCSPATGTG